MTQTVKLENELFINITKQITYTSFGAKKVLINFA